MSEKISPSERQSIHGQWSSRLAFILAVSGSAVGLGNIWKFPYITGVNGGGAFVLIYLLCILAIGFPIRFQKSCLEEEEGVTQLPQWNFLAVKKLAVVYGNLLASSVL